MNGDILIGDCRESLRSLPERSVHTCVTSPPYFGLRDYGVDGQLGLEPTPDEFVAALVEVFREVRRVLRDDGTVWLNLGDSYSNGGRTTRAPDNKNPFAREMDFRPEDGLKPKDIIGIPWRVAFALQADGWYLRQDIIWHKPNPMPESVTDRCTKAHEYIFLLTKSPKYFFDHVAMKEPAVNTRMPGRKIKETDHYGSMNGGNTGLTGFIGKYHEEGLPTHRNRRSVWTVSTKPFKGAHFATYPPDLIEPCVLAGAPEQCCSACGAPYTPVMEKTDIEDPSYAGSTFDKGKTGSRDGGDRTQEGPRYLKRLVGHKPTCDCNVHPVGGTVLDPFFGAGTTGLVAQRNNRRFIGCELNPEYAEMARTRVASEYKGPFAGLPQDILELL